MKSLYFMLELFALFALSVDGATDDALRECGDLLNTDIHKIPNFKGEFANDRCLLKCYTGSVILSSHNINEGFPCVPASKGICHSGHCVGQQKEAQKECGKLHHFDFETLNSTGTMFTNEQCSVKCVIDGKVISTNPINENGQCPLKSNGVCQKGHCVTDGKPVTDGPTAHTTTATDSTPIDSHSQIDEVEITIVKATVLESFPQQDISAEIFVHVEDDCRSNAVKYSNAPVEFNKQCKADKVKSKSSSLYIQFDYHLTDEIALGGFYSEPLVDLLKRLSAKTPNQHTFEETFQLHTILVNNVQKHTADVTLKISFKLRKS